MLALCGILRKNAVKKLDRAQPPLAKNYRLIYDVIQEQGPGRHLSVADVHRMVRRRSPSIGFTTVYRGVARLRDLKLISEILVPGADNAYYEPAGASHAHFRCDRCGKVTDVAYRPGRKLVNRIGAEQKVKIDDVQVSFHGLCARCAAAR